MWRPARSLLSEPAAPGRSPVGVGDRVLAAVVLAAAVAEVLARPDLAWRPVALGLGCALAAATLLRRPRPLAAVALAFGALIVADLAAAVLRAAPVVLHTGAVVLLLLYSLVRWGPGRDLVLGTALAFLAYAAAVVTDPAGAADALGGAAVLLLVVATGAAVRYRAVAHVHVAERARLQERELLARELHDTVAHHVSAIATQAQAGLVLARSPSGGAATEALEVIAREAASTLAEMRTLVHGLRDGHSPAPHPAQHRLADLDGLAGSGAGSLGVVVELRGDLAGLLPSVEAALYRVAQESVTNAHRHARGATRVDIVVTGRTTDVELVVDDDGTGSSPGAGFGLVGMAERVALLGGELTAGPARDGGWSVRAVLPRHRSGT